MSNLITITFSHLHCDILSLVRRLFHHSHALVLELIGRHPYLDLNNNLDWTGNNEIWETLLLSGFGAQIYRFCEGKEERERGQDTT